MQAVAGFPFAYHDDFPLLPGDYRLSFVIKNRATKQFTADEVELRVDPAPSGPGLGGLLLGYKTEIASGLESADAHRVFQLGRGDRLPRGGRNLHAG